MERRFFTVELYHRNNPPIQGDAPAYTVASYTPYDAAQSVVARCSDIVLDPGTRRGPPHWRFIGQNDEDGRVLTIVRELFS